MLKATELPENVVNLAVSQAGLISAAQLNASNINHGRIARLSALSAIKGVSRGVYEIPNLAFDHEVESGRSYDHRRRRAAMLGVLAYGDRAIATGQAALALAGVKGLPVEIRPEVTMQGASPRVKVPEIRIRRVPVDEVVVQEGIARVPVWMALTQAVPELPLRSAVAILDSARNQGLVTDVQLTAALEFMKGKRGCVKARVRWGLSDARSESPAESHARIACADAGFPPDMLQVEVRSNGMFVGRVDLGWRLPDGRWLLGEVDGVEFHSGLRDVAHDLYRQNQLVTARTIVRRWTGAQIGNGQLVRDVASVLVPAGWYRVGHAPMTADI